VEEMTDGGRPLAARTWGERNTVLIRHPLSSVAPGLGRWLDMTPEPLPGDTNMPRVQRPMAGASERLAVSPGREEHGYLHMPGGQSGHPLSPHYRDGNRAWARGEPTPFLPGPAVQILTLQPGTRMVRHRSRVHARSVEAQRRRGTGVRSLSRSSKTALRCPEGAPTRQRQGARGAAVRESERGRRGRHSVDQCEGTSPVRDASRPRGAPRGAKRLVRPWRAPQRGPRTVTPEASGDVPSDGHDPLSGTPRVIAGWPPSARGSRG
jgi:hypothetical protein